MPRSRSRTRVTRRSRSRSPCRVTRRRVSHRRVSPRHRVSPHRHHSGRHLRRHSPVQFRSDAQCSTAALNSGEDWEEKCDAKPGCYAGSGYCKQEQEDKVARTAQSKMAGATRLARSKMNSAQEKAKCLA